MNTTTHLRAGNGAGLDPNGLPAGGAMDPNG